MISPSVRIALPSEYLAYASKKPYPRPVLGREYADAGPAPDYIDLIEDVGDSQAGSKGPRLPSTNGRTAPRLTEVLLAT